MRYLTVAASYTDSGLQDDFDGPLTAEALNLPRSLSENLRLWNEQYQAVIPLSGEQRLQRQTTDVINALDAQGQVLSKEIARALGDAKVRYYSEGKLQYLT